MKAFLQGILLISVLCAACSSETRHAQQQAGNGSITTVTKDSTKYMAKTFYDFELRTLNGEAVDFSRYKGKKVLVVNTASECGYTPQYEDLQQLHEKHGCTE